MLSLTVPFQLLVKFGNFRILLLAEKVPRLGWVSVLDYVRLGKIRLNLVKLG
jgi:hypothetical protein